MVRSALESVDEIGHIETDVANKTCLFSVAPEFDYEAKLDELAQSTSQLDNWSNEESDN
ncbi:MAG: hypothetical protein ACR2NP_17750 [Pirellulaceae bacterium]